MVEVGVAHGRFQILHNDHLKYLLETKKRCRHMIVGITNPDPTLTKHDKTDPHRSSEKANPLTYYERLVMIREALLEAGLKRGEFSIVPFPVNFPELYKYYIPTDATFFLTIYDSWGVRKKEMLESAGLKVKVLWRKPLSEKGITSSGIRRLITSEQPWRDLVPASTFNFLQQKKIIGRLR